MKRRIYAAAAAILMLVSVCGCNAPEYHYDVRRDLSIYFGNADEVIQAVREALVSRSPKITVEYSSSSDNMRDISAVIGEIMMFAMSETDVPWEGDYIYHQYGGYELGYSCESDGSRYSYTITVTPDYYTTPGQEDKVSEKVGEVLSSLGISGMSDEEKVRAIYGYVYDNVSYDSVHKKNPYYHLKTTAYAALMNGCAVCQGYSVLMYRLLREAGINARVITGNAPVGGGMEYHAWNIAEIDGRYYNIDVTWDRLTGTHDNFLKCEEEFSADHIRDPEYSTEEFCSEYPMSDKSIGF